MKKAPFIILLFFSISGFAQETQETGSNICSLIYKSYLRNPEFKGGTEKLDAYIKDNLNYPKSAKRANVSGKVYVKFRVSKRGKIDSVSVLKGLGFGCDDEAIRLVNNMPKWTPCIGVDKKRVSAFFTLPIVFILPD